jgi:hypothetical protein
VSLTASRVGNLFVTSTVKNQPRLRGQGNRYANECVLGPSCNLRRIPGLEINGANEVNPNGEANLLLGANFQHTGVEGLRYIRIALYGEYETVPARML